METLKEEVDTLLKGDSFTVVNHNTLSLRQDLNSQSILSDAELHVGRQLAYKYVHLILTFILSLNIEQ